MGKKHNSNRKNGTVQNSKIQNTKVQNVKVQDAKVQDANLHNDNVKSIVITVLAVLLLLVNIFTLVSVSSLKREVAGLHKASEHESLSSTENASGVNGEDKTEPSKQNASESVSSATQGSNADTPTQQTGEAVKKPGEGKTVYLTFDDGPSNNTRIVLDILDKYNVKATFFVVAALNDSYEDIYKEIVDRGHTIAIHSYCHDYNVVYSDLDSFAADVQSMRDYIYNLTGYTSNIYRFPGGSSSTLGNMDRADCIRYLNAQGIVYFDWNVSSGDASFSFVSPAQIEANIFNDLGTYDESVVLMHDSSSKTSTMVALESVIKRMLDEGYTLKALDVNVKPVQQILSTNY